MTTSLPLSPKQIQSIVESERCRISIWSGAIRAGKTIASIVAFFTAVATAPKSGLILITGRTLQTIERNIVEPMQDPAVFGPLAGYVQHTRGSSTAVVLGRTVHLIGASDVRAEGKLRGLTACLALVDEATLLPEEFWTQLLGRLSVPGARCLATTNPGPPAHYLKKKFIDRRDTLGLGYWHFALDDNPSLDPAYVSSLKSEFSGLWYSRFIEGNWVVADGAVYEVFDPARHVVAHDDLPNMQRVLALGIDYGTTNATAGILLGVGDDNALYFMDEWAPTRGTDADLSLSLAAWLRDNKHEPEFVYVDPAAASFKLQLKNDRVGRTRNATNEVLDGIRLMASVLSTGQLRVSDRCSRLLDEFPGYVWDERATEKGEDKPRKENDHFLDSARYSLASTQRVWRRYVPNQTAPTEEAADAAA